MINLTAQGVLMLFVLLIATPADNRQSDDFPSAQPCTHFGSQFSSHFCFQPTHRGPQWEENQVLAGAAEAAVDSSIPATMFDHYGDPAGFVKYIIRRPPVHA